VLEIVGAEGERQDTGVPIPRGQHCAAHQGGCSLTSTLPHPFPPTASADILGGLTGATALLEVCTVQEHL